MRDYVKTTGSLIVGFLLGTAGRRLMRPRRREDTRQIETTTLLAGALFALEQCVQLLSDASVLLEHRRFQTSAAIALLAHEELGRHKILLEQWRASAAGACVTRAVLKSLGWMDHRKRQQRGALSLVTRGQTGDRVYGLIRTRRNAALGSKNRRAADQELNRLDDDRHARQPRERHERRMNAMYVDLGDDGTWSRPRDLTPQSCADDVIQAIDDCTSARLSIEEAAVRGDIQLAEALAALPNRPTFPPLANLSIEALLPSSYPNEAR